MRLHGLRALTICLIMLAATSCSVALNRNPTPALTEQRNSTSTIPAEETTTASPATDLPTLSTPLPAAPTAQGDFCTDPQPLALIRSFKTALQTSDGVALASLVSPDHGMEARLYRNGRTVSYDQASSRFLFVSSFVVEWGPAPGSGLETKGSFHELVVPALLDVLNKNYSLKCNQVEVGGTTYKASWPYPGVNFYSVYDAGSQANGYLDWHTWLLGIKYVGGKPYLDAIMPFQWEP